MKRELLDVYVCPVNHSRLTPGQAVDDMREGQMTSAEGISYPIRKGIPIFIHPAMLSDEELAVQVDYDASAEAKYEAAIEWQFRVFYENEDTVREGMIDLLHLRPDSHVLEIGSGTGRDSYRILRRLGPNGTLFSQDLSEQMVYRTDEVLAQECAKLANPPSVQCFVSTARLLPFPNGYFDAMFHFGGVNNFSETKLTIKEMTRVVKKGGRVVLGDEAVPPWLEDTDFGRIMVNNNPLFKNHAPLDCLPENARDVVVRWVLGSCFYLFDYTVGDGPPPVDLDLPHQGWRGGTLRSRYYGRLEGVTVEARQMAIDTARAEGKSVHEWLDALVRKAAAERGRPEE